MTGRTVDALWEGGLRCTVQAGRFQLTVDEPEQSGGTDTGCTGQAGIATAGSLACMNNAP